MAWAPGWGWFGPWPGRGPFSHLPPWQRPGWLFGRGWCHWLFGWPWAFYRPFMYPPVLYYGYPFAYPYFAFW